ncbi:hypothetical protein SFRURICE_015339 [Spodoptera frugiperda]|uniref:SFRICE_023832 n=1 Tax=Spodoptera frugiperda TaxID=7108 RepID=A0A2H1WEH4_SPOFR|nr:hypothetical protein SFRURICE_015339 [Spodoptera frugiperda]
MCHLGSLRGKCDSQLHTKPRKHAPYKTSGLRTASKGSSPPDQNQTRAYGASRSARASKSQTTTDGAHCVACIRSHTVAPRRLHNMAIVQGVRAEQDKYDNVDDNDDYDEN